MYITLDGTEIESFVTTLAAILSSEELKDTQTLFMTGAAEPQFSDFSRITSLRHFVGRSQSGWLLDMLAVQRVTSHFQPIVHAVDTSCIFGQEALMRGIGEDGSLISPGRILEQARDANLLFQLDLIARRTAVRSASQHGLKDNLFINFTPTSIYDPAFCLRSTVSAIDEAGIPHESTIFEVTESEYTHDIGHLKNILRFYRDAGFLVALDDFGAGYSNLNLLHQLRPDFIKIDMDLIRNVHQDPYKAMIAEKILEVAQHLSILAIAEGIESPEELHWVRSHGANFVQGYLIAKPTSPPVTITGSVSN